MKKNEPCLTIGTIGIILTAILQITVAFFTSSAVLHTLFYILYIVFIILLVMGYRKIVKEKNQG